MSSACKSALTAMCILRVMQDAMVSEGIADMYVGLSSGVDCCCLNDLSPVDCAGQEVYLSHLEQLCVPHATPTKASTYTYSMF